MNSGSCKISITSWMYDFSMCCRCLIFVFTRVSCSNKVLVERRFYIVCWFVFWVA